MENGQVKITVRLPVEVYEATAQAAIANHRSLNGEITHILDLARKGTTDGPSR